MKTQSSHDTLTRDIQELVGPLTANAYTARQFAYAGQKFEELLREQGYVSGADLSMTNFVSSVGESLRHSEESAEENDAMGERLGMSREERKARFQMNQDINYVHSQAEVNAMRAWIKNWARRFPQDDYVAHWQANLDQKQYLNDLMSELGGEPIPPTDNPFIDYRKRYPDPPYR